MKKLLIVLLSLGTLTASASDDYKSRSLGRILEREGKTCEVEILRDFIFQSNRHSSSYMRLNLVLPESSKLPNDRVRRIQSGSKLKIEGIERQGGSRLYTSLGEHEITIMLDNPSNTYPNFLDLSRTTINEIEALSDKSISINCNETDVIDLN
jgi:hypothetical protein